MADFSFGTAVEYEGGATIQPHGCAVDTNKFVPTFRVSNPAYGIACSISGTTPTFGTRVEGNSNASAGGENCTSCKVNTNVFAMVFTDDNNNDRPCIIAGSLSGTTITFGTKGNVAENSASYHKVAQITTDKVIYTYTQNSQRRAVCASFSGTTVTLGGATAAGVGSTRGACCALSSSKFLAIYIDGGADINGRVGTLSGTTIAWGTETEIKAGADLRDLECCYVEDDKAIIMYNDDDNNKIYTRVLTTSGTTISTGNEVELNAHAGNQTNLILSCVAMDTSNIVYTYRNAANGFMRLGAVSGNTITLNSAETFAADVAANTGPGIGKVDTTKVALSYLDSGSDGMCIVADVTLPSSSSIKEVSGVAQASVKKVSGVTNANIKKLSGVTN